MTPGTGVAVDASGSAYVTGFTDSSDFPTTAGAFDTSANGGLRDAFVTKLDAAGAALAYSTYLGGSGDDYGYGRRGRRERQRVCDGLHRLERLPDDRRRVRHEREWRRPRRVCDEARRGGRGAGVFDLSGRKRR